MSVSGAAREGRLRSLEVAVTDCLRRWGTDYPDEMVGIKHDTDYLRQTQARDGGMSRGKHLLAKAAVPVTLMRRMQKEIDKNWLWEPEIRDVFFRLFRIGCINKGDLSRR